MTGTPSTCAALMAECRGLGICFSLTGEGGVSIDAPRDALTPDLFELLKSHKTDVLESLERFEERAAIIEFDAGLSRSEAERLAWKECFTN